MQGFRRCFLGEIKFVLSNEDLSILYESWDVQLTFDTLINAFKFNIRMNWAYLLKDTFCSNLSIFLQQLW